MNENSYPGVEYNIVDFIRSLFKKKETKRQFNNDLYRRIQERMEGRTNATFNIKTSFERTEKPSFTNFKHLSVPSLSNDGIPKFINVSDFFLNNKQTNTPSFSGYESKHNPYSDIELQSTNMIKMLKESEAASKEKIKQNKENGYLSLVEVLMFKDRMDGRTIVGE